MKRILWFRRDLRVEDNPLLSLEGEVFPIFIFDKNILQHLEKNDKRISFIYKYVHSLKEKLQSIGLDLKIFYGTPLEVFRSLHIEDFDEVVASGDYDSYAKQRDIEVSHLLHFRYINDVYLFEPNEILKKDGSPYLVFTPYYKKAIAKLKSQDIETFKRVKQKLYNSDYHCDITLALMGFEEEQVSVAPIDKKIKKLKMNLKDYKIKRDFFNSDVTSDLSAELRFGLLSIRELYKEMQVQNDSEAFIRQLIFRDFYAYLLFHFPYIETNNYKYKFKGIEDEEKYKRLCTAQTGVPVIDAGVTQLLKTGKMHNRIRMVVASFFTKDLLLPWQWGEKFFAKYLLDYDAASNILSWQWSAGTGVDPQPYFRIFNPYLQSKKFDKDGTYIKKYLPLLKNINSKYLHDEEYLFNNTLEDYPKPMVKHKIAAKIVLDKFKNKDIS